MGAPAAGQPRPPPPNRPWRAEVVIGALLCALQLATTATARAEDTTPEPIPRARFHLYLLLGQSNMFGRGPLPATDVEVHPRVLALDGEGRWVPARDPLHASVAETATDVAKAGVGPGLSFGRRMAEHDADVHVGLIPCAVGGTQVRAWRRGRPHYQRALARARTATRDGVLMGILWHQGESDTYRRRTAARYAEQLDAMIGEWRADLGSPVPFVAGRIADPNGGENIQLINTAIAELPERVPRTAVVDVAGLETSGPWHFTADAARELGRRYAAALLTLRAGEGR